MSWPTWSAATAPIPTAVAAPVQSTLLPTAVNPTPAVIAPMGYSQDQWTQAQQQNWQQWAQWQQQYQQWHQQYGAEYQKSLNAMQGTLPNFQVQPPLPGIPSTVAPPLPLDNKPPLPPEDPPAQLTAGFPQNYAAAAPTLGTQPPVQPLYQVQPTQQAWQTTPQKRPFTQDGEFNESAKKMMMQKPPPNQWQSNIPNYSQPPPQALATQAPPPVQTSTQTKPKPEELSEAEKKFDKEFAAWESQFNKWKEQNANHPDKTQYKEYEKKWESWRNSLLERREQMRRKRLALCGQAAPLTQKPDTASSNVSQTPTLPKPALLGTYAGAKPVKRPTNDVYNKPTPNQNNEPLTFSSPTSYHVTEHAAEKEGAGFLTSSSSAEGIPGLDLVKDDIKEDLPDRSEEVREVSIEIVDDKPPPTKGPDFEAISKGINTILGDQKLLSMLSMVSQNTSSVTPTETTTKDIPTNVSNATANYGVPPPNFQQFPPNYNAPPPIFEGPNKDISKFSNDYTSQGISHSGKGDGYQKWNDKFDEPPPLDIKSSQRFTQDNYGSGPQYALDNYGSGPQHALDNYGSGPQHARDNFGFGERNAQNNFDSGVGNNPPFRGRNGGFDQNINRFNRNDQFNDHSQDRNDKFRAGRFEYKDNYSNRDNSNRDVCNKQYGRSGNVTFQEEDYDEYDEQEDYDRYNDMFKDEDEEQYHNTDYRQQKNTFQPSHQVKIPSLMDITPERMPPQSQAKIPSLLDITPEPPHIQPVVPDNEDDAIFEPTTVIDYEHCSKIEPDNTVAVVPVNMYDYGHRPVNLIPHSERPNWLAEAVKFIREFDPSIKRYEGPPAKPVESRYQAPIIREENPYDHFEERDRHRDRKRRERSFEKDNFFKEKERMSIIGTSKRYRSRDSFKDEFKKEEFDTRRKSTEQFDTRRKSTEQFDTRRKSTEQFDNRQNPTETFDNRRKLTEEFDSRRKSTEDKFDIRRKSNEGNFGSFKDIIKNAEEISDTEMGFEQNEQARHCLDMERRRSVSPQLSNPPNPSARQIEITMIEDILNAPGRYNRPPRLVIILRGPPGSGKTFLAKQIKDKEVENGGSAPRILSLDDYFMVEHEKQVIVDGKIQMVKEMVYEYEADMEESYRQSFLKSFKKTITDGYFPFIVVDNVNDKVKHFGEMWSFAKQNGFQVYICQMDLDPVQCSKRNIHNRSELEIEEIISGWEPTPSHHPTIDATGLLQNCAITEVEMEVDDDKNSIIEDTIDQEDQVRSKWDTFDYSNDNLAKLDGISKPLRKSRTMEEYLQMECEWQPPKPTKLGKKRVRWADLEEQRNVEKMKAIGFVVGHTDWERIMDPAEASRKALTQTKYIENVSNYKY